MLVKHVHFYAATHRNEACCVYMKRPPTQREAMSLLGQGDAKALTPTAESSYLVHAGEREFTVEEAK